MQSVLPSIAGRLAASMAVGSGVLHLAALPGLPLVIGLSMVFAAISCLSCARSLWRGPSVTTWLTVGLMNVSMLGLHAFAMSLAHPADGAGAVSSHASLSAHLASHLRGDGWDLMHVASALAGAEAGLALLVLVGHVIWGSRDKQLSSSTPVEA